MTDARGSYRVEEQLHGLSSELERLRAQALLSWREESRLLGFLGLSDGMDVPDELGSFKFARMKSKLAGTIRGSYFVIKGTY